jgi:NitT/TauT family transport system permease protein
MPRSWNEIKPAVHAIVAPVLAPVLAIALLLALWELLVWALTIPVFILPAPSVIWREASTAWPSLLRHTGVTAQTVLLGFVLSLVLSLPIAMALSWSAVLSNAIYPLLVLTQSIPKVALAPILIVALGTSELPRVIVTFLVAFCPLVVATATGLQSTPPELVELAQSVRASKWKTMYRIRLFYAVPFIFGGLKVATALAVVGAVVAEFVSANAGLGYLITSSMAFFKVPIAWAAMIVLSAMGILLFHVVSFIERRFFPWSQSESKFAA